MDVDITNIVLNQCSTFVSHIYLLNTSNLTGNPSNEKLMSTRQIIAGYFLVIIIKDIVSIHSIYRSIRRIMNFKSVGEK